MLSCKTRKVKHHAATALRMGANSLCRAKGYFCEFSRRMRAKPGTAQAITATAHKIARILSEKQTGRPVVALPLATPEKCFVRGRRVTGNLEPGCSGSS